MRVIPVFILLEMLLANLCQAQQSNDSYPVYAENLIGLNSLVGFWQVEGERDRRIEFIDSTWYQLTLDLKDNFHPFYFPKQKDNMVSNSGYFPNWPPYSCNLTLKDSLTLQIVVTKVGDTMQTLNCRKVK